MKVPRTAHFTMNAAVTALAIVAFIATTAAMNAPPGHSDDETTAAAAQLADPDYVIGNRYAWRYFGHFVNDVPNLIGATPINHCGKMIFRRTERPDAIILKAESIDHSGCENHADNNNLPCEGYLGIEIQTQIPQTFCNLTWIGMKIIDDVEYPLRIVLRFESSTNTRPFRLGIRVGVLKNEVISEEIRSLERRGRYHFSQEPFYAIDYKKLADIRSRRPIDLPYGFSWLKKLLEGEIFETGTHEFDLEGSEELAVTYLTETVHTSTYAMRKIFQAI